MLYPRQLRVRIQDRKARLFRSGYTTYHAELRYFLHFLHENHYTRAMLDEIDADTSVDFEQWVEDVDQWGGRQFPDTEEGRAKVCYGILKQCADANRIDRAVSWGSKFGSGIQLDELLHNLNDSVVEPLINFLHDRIDDGGNVLYLIERFKLKTEWFRRGELHSLYTGNTRSGERNLDQQLRAGLFDGGIDYPFSDPSSPSGRADIVALLESDDPLVLEVKVFDPDRSRGRSHIRQGFQQVLRYAQDYNQSVGYLVIFNCSDRQLVISTEEASEIEFPPRINYGGKTIFVITIDVHPDVASASRERPADRQVISSEELIGAQGARSDSFQDAYGE